MQTTGDLANETEVRIASQIQMLHVMSNVIEWVAVRQIQGGQVMIANSKRAKAIESMKSKGVVPNSRNQGRGDRGGETGIALSPAKSKRRASPLVKSLAPLHDTGDVPSDVTEKLLVPSNTPAGEREIKFVTVSCCSLACRDLQELQRRRITALKSRIRIDNELAAILATTLGYYSGQEESDRKAMWDLSRALIAAFQLVNSTPEPLVARMREKTKAKYDAAKELLTTHAEAIERVHGLLLNTGIARDGFATFVVGLEKEMERIAETLPVSEFINGIRGVGIKSLAVIIGETGDLSLYANPAKVWKRMGCAPYQGKMPSTWKFGKEGKLSADQWTEIGYSPRRRSVMFVIGEGIVKQNDGAYRKRYDETKAAAKAKHPDWPDKRCHYHGMLLAVKRLLLDLWVEWQKAATTAGTAAPT